MSIDSELGAFTTPNIQIALVVHPITLALKTQKTTLLLDEVDRYLADFDRRTEGQYPPFAPEWQDIRKQFQENLLSTQETVQRIIASDSELQNALNPITSSEKNAGVVIKEGLEEFRIVVDDLMQQCHNNAKDAQAYGEKFYLHQRGVRLFAAKFERAVKNPTEHSRLLASGVMEGVRYFTDIWNSISSDVESIRRYLKQFKDHSTKLPMMSRIYLKNARTISIHLATVITTYTTTLTTTLTEIGLLGPVDEIGELAQQILAAAEIQEEIDGGAGV